MIKYTIQIFTIIILFSFILINPVLAERPESVEITCNDQTTNINVDNAVSAYNNNTDIVPNIMKSTIKTNTTDFSIKNTSMSNYTIQMNSELQITKFDTNKPSNPDAIVYTEKDVACDLVKSNEPIQDFQEAYDKGEIEIEGQGVVNSAKVFLIDLASDITGSLFN